MEIYSNTKVQRLIHGNTLLAEGGLSNAFVLNRQTQEGFNELPMNKPKKFYYFVFEVLKEPMVYLLLACGVIYFFLGDPHEAMMLLGFLVFIIAITITQETKAGRALEALSALSSPRALVIRERNKFRVAGREVVREEILFLNEGDKVPADSIVISAANLGVDESLLTGESLPVIKSISDEVIAGTTVISGHAIAMVEAIGLHSQIGKIGSSIKDAPVISTRLEIQTNLLVKRIAWFALFLCLLVVIIHSIHTHNWIEGSLLGLSLGMAILPNELPAVLTIFFSLGAWRLSKRKVLTRKISAVENLGSVTVLCVDKTGTLTLNQMAIQKIFSQENTIDLSETSLKILPEEFHEALEYGILASRKKPFDPMELAFTSAGVKFLKDTEHLHHNWSLEKEYPLSPELLSVTHAWKTSSTGEGFVIGAKGAPEAIIDLCHMNESDSLKIKSMSEKMASEGLRILGIAKSHFDTTSLPVKQHDFEFKFLGLIGISDPIRDGVQESISECKSAGIRVIMLTGDHPITASSIAKKIGLKNPNKVITGLEMEYLKDNELAESCKTTSVFSRVMPNQKLRLVEILKKAGEVVAMTGDGVNDAPALKASHIGIAMGGRGTDVARESSDIVILDDDFTSIVESIKTGRRVYANIKKTLVYLFSIHIPIAGLSVIPVLLGLPLVLLPAHIALLHLIIEPVSSIAFEAEPASRDLMTKKPRSPLEPLFNKDIWKTCSIRGFILWASLSFIYMSSVQLHGSDSKTRTLVFASLILSNTFMIFLSRDPSRTLLSKLKTNPSRAIWIIGFGSLILLGCCLYLPFIRVLLKFALFLPTDLLFCFLVSSLSTLLTEFCLWFFAKADPKITTKQLISAT